MNPNLSIEPLPAHRRFVRFPTQRPNEKVVLLLRRHWSIMLWYSVLLIIGIVLPIGIYALLLNFTDIITLPVVWDWKAILVVEITTSYYLFMFLAYFNEFVGYHLDVWIVSDQRIVSIEQQHLFKRVISEVSILRIQDVTSEVDGKLPTLLDFGHVHIQTAGAQERFIFEQVEHPAEVARIILQVHERAVHVRDITQMEEEAAIESRYQREHPGSTTGMYQATRSTQNDNA